MAFSDPGKIVYEVHYAPFTTMVYEMRPDGSGVMPLTKPREFEVNTEPACSPDGHKIVFVHLDYAPQEWEYPPPGPHSIGDEIWMINADGSNPTRLTKTILTIQSPTFSPDGRKITFAATWRELPSPWGWGSEIYIMNADGSNIVRLTSLEIRPDGRVQHVGPALSPDGRTIVFTWQPHGRTRETEPMKPAYLPQVYAMNVDGTHIRPLTTLPLWGVHPQFSPNGRKIVFTSQGNDDQNERIYVMNADGSHIVRLSNVPGNDASFSPDGSKIVFDSLPNPDIYVMNADGSHVMRLTTGGRNLHENLHPSWCPPP